MALLRLLVVVAGAFSKQVTPEQTPTVGPLATVSLQFESLQGGLGLAQWTWKRRRMTLETTTALVLSVVWWWRLGTAEITGRSAPFPLGRARFASEGGAPNEDTRLTRGGVLTPREVQLHST